MKHKNFRKICGNDLVRDAYSRDRASSSYIWELVPGLRLLMLDVNGVKEPGSVPKETLQWMETQLKDAEKHGSRVIAFSHQNLLKHSMFEDGCFLDGILGVFQKSLVRIKIA